MRFTDAYAACPVCSPTRASILTGKYPVRFPITDYIPGNRRGKLNPAPVPARAPDGEVTIAEALKEAGYATAFVGKWHLGGPGFLPDRQGFDLNIGGSEQGAPRSYFSPYRMPSLPDGPPGEYLTDRLTDEAVRFIEGSRRETPRSSCTCPTTRSTPRCRRSRTSSRSTRPRRRTCRRRAAPRSSPKAGAWPGRSRTIRCTRRWSRASTRASAGSWRRSNGSAWTTGRS